MEYEYLFEDRQHSTDEKPFSYHYSRMPDFFADVGLHWHNEFEINVMRSGSAVYQIGTDVFILGEGDISIKAPGILHATHADKNNIAVYDTLVFRPELLGFGKYERSYISHIRPLLKKKTMIKNPITPSDPGYEQIYSALCEAVEAAKSNTAQSDILLKSSLNKAFYLLIENGYVISNEFSGKHDADIETLRPALQYIADNYDKEIRISQLAALTARSETAFMVLFKKTLGVSAVEYITHLRLSASCEMLCHTDMSIIGISQSCGYANLSNYNRLFKKKLGMTPREFREQNKVFDNNDK